MKFLLTLLVFCATSAFSLLSIANERPEPPHSLSFQKINDTSAVISWKPPQNQSHIHGYNVYMQDKYLTTALQPQALVKNLDKNKSYQIYVITIVKKNGKDFFSGKSRILNVLLTKGGPVQKPDGTLPAEIKRDYRLVFNDDFNKPGLDLKKWNTSYIWGPNEIINNELQYYVDIKNQPNFGYNPFKSNGKHLEITAIKTPKKLKSKASGQEYLSGTMTTWDSFRAKYGYFEMRAQVPQGKGLWSAFWLLHVDQYKTRPEIDIMESLGSEPSVIYNTSHYRVWTQNGQWKDKRTPSWPVYGYDFSQSFHTYGVKWEPGLIVWYLNGIEQNRFESNEASSEEMYILINLAVGGNWPKAPDKTTTLPAIYKIDYVRAYAKK